MNIIKNTNLSFLLIVAFSLLHSQENSEFTKKIEKKWEMQDSDEKLNPKKNLLSDHIVPVFLSQFQPEKQEFIINPSMENEIIGKFGTKITIPANSIALPYGYKRGNILTLELIEIYNDLDFITSGISLEFYNPKLTIFESGGMFKLSGTFYDKPLHLKKGVKLKVEIPRLIHSNRKMSIFKFDEREGWKEKGDLGTSESNENSETSERISNYLYKFMDDFKWWNADYSNPDTICLEGSVIPFEANPPYSVISVGIDYKNAATRYADKTRFQINVIKGKRVKLIAMDALGNIGLSTELDVRTLESQKKNLCIDVGNIRIEKISRDILKNRQKLLNHLGLVDIISP